MPSVPNHPAGSPVRRFRFATGAPPRREIGYPRFVDELIVALAAAAGLDLSFTLRWPTGRGAAPEIEADSPAAERWVRGDLSRPYAGARWLEAPAPRPQRRRRWIAVGVVDPVVGLPPVTAEGGTAWSESARRGLASLPRGLTVVWEARVGPTVPAPRPSPPPIEPVVLPPGVRLSAPSAAERALRDTIDARRRGLSWSVSAGIELDEERARSLLPRATTLLARTSGHASGSGMRWVRAWPWTTPPQFVLRTAEVAGLFPTPWSAPGAPPERSESPASLVLGRSGLGTIVRVPVPREEGRHLAILGQTGMGKSTALVRLALQAAREGAVVLFDPIGDTARSLLDHLPAAYADRSRWVDAARGTATFNALAPTTAVDRSPVQRQKARGDLADALRRVRLFRYPDTPFWGPRLEEVLGRALSAAGAYPDATLVHAERLLAGVGRRNLVGVPPEARPALEALDEYARNRPEEVDGARRLLGEVTGNETLRRLLCDPRPSCDAPALLRPGQLVVITGEAPTLGEGAARYFLGVMLALVWNELLARPGGSKTFLVLDEGQWYAHEAASEILRLGRRSNVHLWLATQSLASLTESVQEAVLTNVADFVVFRGSPEDAREFARWSAQVEADAFLSLGRGEAIALVGPARVPERIWLSPLPPGDPRQRGRRAAADRPPPGRDEGASRLRARAGPGGEEVRPVDLLIVAAEAAGPGATFEFPFARVRSVLDPTGSATRNLGAELQRAGALTDRRSGPAGDVWLIDRGGLARWRSGRADLVVPTGAAAAWERLVRGRSDGG